jgi:hypothetical protein
MTLVRAVRCAWCSAEIVVAAPNVGREGYFLLPRTCRACAGNNLVELQGAVASVRQVRRTRRLARSTIKMALRSA